MKKTLLATAILSGLVSATAGAATVYDNDGTSLSIGGRAEVRGEFKSAGTMDDKSRARINVAGETKISDTLTGFGFVEYQITDDSDNDDGTALTNRYLYAGLATQYGDFSYGKQGAANVQLSDMSDIANYHSGIQQIITGSEDNQSNTFLYSSTFDALTVQADYQAVSEEDKDTFGLSAVYALDFGLDLGVAYTDGDDSYQTTFGAAYSADALYVAATYAIGDIDSDTDFDSLEVAVAYQLTEQVGLVGIYELQETNDVETVDAYALEANYSFNGNLSSFVSYQFNQIDDDSLVAGMKYKF